MRIVVLIIGVKLSVLFLIKLKKGEEYESMLTALDESSFPMKDLYGAGFAWSEKKPFIFQGKIPSNLKTNATLLYEPQYAEYYANVVWAQAITLTHLFLAVTFLIAVILWDMAGLLLGAGLFMSLIVAVYCLEKMKNDVEARAEECERQLPEVVSTLAILVNSGMMLREAWGMVATSGEGALYQLMQKATDDMANGRSDADAVYLFGKLSNATEVKKFTSALIQSMEKGGGELTVFLSNQSSELWKARRQLMLQAGEKAATKLLLPIMVIFMGVILIVMTAAFAGSLF